MAYDEDYVELMDNAKSAIRALLAESTEESWIALRSGLREIRQAIGAEQVRDEALASLERLRKDQEEFEERRNALKQRAPEAEEPADDWRPLYEERRLAWRHKPMAYKEGIVIEALGDDQLTIRELTKRVNELVGWTTNTCLYESNIDSLTRRLMAARQLDRIKVQIGAREIWHYHRRRDLLGPIADLERAYRDDGEAVA